MSDGQRNGDPVIGSDLRFQRRMWRIQRVSWLAMALVLLSAVLGVFGQGPLSAATVGDRQGPLYLEYPRFGRARAPMTIRIHPAPVLASQGELRLWLDRGYVESAQIEQITPNPSEVEAGPDRLIYTFHVGEHDQLFQITIHLRPERFGPVTGRIGVEDGEYLRFRQFIYP